MAFVGELPSESLPPVTELPVDVFVVRSAVCAVLRVEYHVNMKGSPPAPLAVNSM